MTDYRRVWDLVPVHAKLTAAAVCSAAGRAVEEWPEITQVRKTLEFLAVDRLKLELQNQNGWSATHATEEAAWQLGIALNTHWSRMRRARRKGGDS